MSPAFSSVAAFLNMGGYALYVWLAVAVTRRRLWPADGAYPVARRALFHELRRQQARERRIAPPAP
jgi:heme exporter protein D